MTMVSGSEVPNGSTCNGTYVLASNENCFCLQKLHSQRHRERFESLFPLLFANLRQNTTQVQCCLTFPPETLSVWLTEASSAGPTSIGRSTSEDIILHILVTSRYFQKPVDMTICLRKSEKSKTILGSVSLPLRPNVSTFPTPFVPTGMAMSHAPYPLWAYSVGSSGCFRGNRVQTDLQIPSSRSIAAQ